MRANFFCLTLYIWSCALTQAQCQTTRPKKVLTPDEIAYQQNLKTYGGEMDRLRASAKAALAQMPKPPMTPMCASHTRET